MSSSDFFYGISDFFAWIFVFFDWIGNKFNTALLLLGFFGLFFWLNTQRKLSDKAAKDPNKLK